MGKHKDAAVGVLENREQSLNVLDILKYLGSYWPWFILSIVLFGGYYFYDYSKTPFMYGRSQTVLIKTPANTPATARFTRANAGYNSVSVASETLQLRSKELMRQTVGRLGADISYSRKIGLRTYELYDKSPVKVQVVKGKPESTWSLLVTPLNKDSIELDGWQGKSTQGTIRVAIGQSLKTPLGEIKLDSTVYYSENIYGKPIHIQKFAREQMVSFFLSNLKIRQMEDDAFLLHMSLEDLSGQRASDILTDLITVYNSTALQDLNQTAVNTANFIKNRLQIIEEELNEVETDIERLKVNNQGVDVGAAGQMYLNEARQFQTERTKIETDKRLVEMMREYLTRGNKSNELIPNNTGLVDANVEGQIVEYNKALLRRNRLEEGSSTANPVVQELDQGLNAMHSNILRAIDNTLSGLQVKINNTRREETQVKGQVLQIPGQQRLMLEVERKQKVKEDLYLFLLNKREENALNQAMTEDNIRVVDPAYGADGAIYPKRLKKVGLGVMIGTVLPTVFLLLMLILDTGVRTRQDIEKVVTAPFLGELPLEKKNDEKGIAVSKAGRDPLTEAFRILRTNINFMARDGAPPQVITFGSFTIGAGKTFNVMNLSATISYLKKRVIMLDLDLRKGTLTKRLGIRQKKGVTHYLSDNALGVDEIICESPLSEGVDCIPIGVLAPNPVELLLSQRLDELIRELKKRYDYIIVDGVPVGIVADAAIISRISDLTIFVIRAGKMDRRQLPELEALYQSNKLSRLGIVLNGVKLGSGGYGRYGYGGYGYSYGYSYGTEKRTLWKKVFG
ncbi:GumC family protein [Sphingobacterium faecale]|uniref:non-specific protein-tyrosine kinase n=1 Tax=Sphingobacterium faecale TaxID=2803775 RepID=A0ABS1QXX0_9SPHI|nr:polysaccharide biosynthesis tyrosine autokinase [Sphingobacterium faecale]MBL1407282.1 polysaccharide biosynthesis tyrosine autokinase [Sphingobacterium faecale]